MGGAYAKCWRETAVEQWGRKIASVRRCCLSSDVCQSACVCAGLSPLASYGIGSGERLLQVARCGLPVVVMVSRTSPLLCFCSRVRFPYLAEVWCVRM